jgi:hypothetical protein
LTGEEKGEEAGGGDEGGRPSGMFRAWRGVYGIEFVDALFEIRSGFSMDGSHVVTCLERDCECDSGKVLSL